MWLHKKKQPNFYGNVQSRGLLLQKEVLLTFLKTVLFSKKPSDVYTV